MRKRILSMRQATVLTILLLISSTILIPTSIADEILDEENIGLATRSVPMEEADTWFAQGFKPDVCEVTKIGVQLSRTSDATWDYYTIALYSSSGGNPSSNLKSHQYTMYSVPTSMTWIYYDFASTPVSVTPDDTYFVVVHVDYDQPTGHYLKWHVSVGNTYSKGVLKFSLNGGTGWSTYSDDAGFRVYGNMPDDPTITFQTYPTTVGSITFDEITYYDNDTVQKPEYTYDIKANTDPSYIFTEWVTSGDISVDEPYEKETTATVTGDGTLKAKFYYISLGEAVDNTDLSWTTGGDSEWFGQVEEFYYDDDAAQSGDIGNNENVWIKTVVTGPVQLKFWWKEEGDDHLRFKIDGDEKATYDGYLWESEKFTIEPGDHTLKWVYEKDGSGSSGRDCGWLDKVRVGQMYKIDFYTNPSDGGGIIFDESTYYDGESTYDINGDYAIEADPASNHEFDHWVSTGGISIADPDLQSTTATISGDGTITAWFSYYFVHITDPHVIVTNQPKTRWKYVINTIKSWDPAPKFVVCTGDLADHGKGNPTVYNQILEPFSGTKPFFYITGTNIPIYFCPGNHDARHGWQWFPPFFDFETYHDKIGPDYYTDKAKKSYAIFSLNGGWDIFPYPPEGCIGKWDIPEGEGLRDMYGNEVTNLPIDLDDLDGTTNGADTSDYVKILLVHQPWLTTLDPKEDGVFWYGRNEFENNCQNYSVDLVLSGHIHYGNCILDKYGNDWSSEDVTRFIITNGIKNACGYRNITVNPIGSTSAVDPGPQDKFNSTMELLAGSQVEGHGYDKDQNHIGVNNETGVLECDIPYATISQVAYYDENESIIGNHTEMSVFRQYDQEYDFVVNNLCGESLNITLITELKSGHESVAKYNDITVDKGGVVYISIDNAIIDYWLKVDDDGNGTIDFTVPPSSFEGNLPPEKPETPSGPTYGKKNLEYEYTFSGIDPDYNDDVSFKIDWGDESSSNWTDYQPSGSINVTHSWDTDWIYFVTVKVKDEDQIESDWSDPLIVTIKNSNPCALDEPDPHHLEIGVNRTPILSWNGGDPDPGDSVQYELTYGPYLNPSPTIVDVGTFPWNQTRIEYQMEEPLKPARLYIWSVEANDGCGGTNNSGYYLFTTRIFDGVNVGTQITMASGFPSTKPIEDIEVGEFILSYNPISQMTTAAEVIEVYEFTEGLPEHNLIFNNNLEVIPNNNIYINGIGWMEADDAQIGYYMLRNTPGIPDLYPVIISSKEPSTRPVGPIYDLEIIPLAAGEACGYFADGILVGGYD